MEPQLFKGAAKRIEDLDLPRIGEAIGVGEDPIHTLIEVETRGTGFDKQDRVIMLFEPHVLFRLLRGAKRQQAVDAGLAYRNWGERPYPKDSYPRLLEAIKIDETAALKSCSWGLGQIMGENHEAAGYDSVQEMVQAFADDEDNQLEAMINFIIANRIDDDLRRIQEKIDRGETVTAGDWIPVVRIYNGKGYARNDYHNRCARALARWRNIKDTPYSKNIDLKKVAEAEESDWQHTSAFAEAAGAHYGVGLNEEDGATEPQTTAPVVAVAPVETVAAPVPGGGVDDPTKQASTGGYMSRVLAMIGGATGIGTAIKGMASGTTAIIIAGIVCATLIFLTIMFRQILLDWLRMKLHADPSKINVK